MKQVSYWIKFLSPGSFCANEFTEDCDETTKPQDVEIPDNAYAFTMHKREDVIDSGETYKGKVEQIGPVYYHPDSIVEALDEVKKNPSSTGILISNMECNEWDYIVWSRWGNWPQPFEKSKHTIQEPNNG